MNDAEKVTTRESVLDGDAPQPVDEVLEGVTKSDEDDLHRLGRKQELKRNFRAISALSFTVVLQATWEFLLIANTQGLIDGGIAGLFWSYLWTFIGFGIVMLSLAEMASMAPTSGGQYHWVSEFAPPQYQKFLSYLTGWMSTLSWQAGTASGSFLLGTIIQGLITTNDPSYEGTAWQGTLLTFAMTAILFVVNVWGSNELPLFQTVLFVVHVVGMIVVVVVFAVCSPHVSGKAVFTQFTNEGGWSSMGLALMIGQISAIYGSLCSDASAHMAEEISDAAINVPRAMVYSYVINGILALGFLIAYLFCLVDVDAAINDPSTYPFIYVFRKAVSLPAVNALTALICILVLASNVSFNASTARQTFAFARDRGFPFYKWMGAVDKKRHVPTNAIIFTCTLTCLLALINIGSYAAFNAIISLQVCALTFTYAISTACVLWRRITDPDSLPPARWGMGKLTGIAVNAFGCAYTTFAFFWSLWPNGTPVDAESFNWSVVLFGGTFVFCVVMYVAKGRKVYDGPVVLVQGRKLVPRGELRE